MLVPSRKHRKSLALFRPRLEILEARTLLSVCTVDRLTDNNPAGGGEGSNGMGDLHYCIARAADGDSISFKLAGTINLTGALPDLTRNITIDGPGADRLTVQRSYGINYYGIFNVATGVTASITGLTITNGNGVGGGITNNGNLTVTNSTISENYGIAGGIVNNAVLSVDNCVISGNHTNSMYYGGGGIYNGGTMTLSNSTVSANTANSGSAYGGGIYQRNGTLTIADSIIANNTTTGFGGGIFLSNSYSGNVIVSNSTISGNTANGSSSSSGGGIYIGSTSTITVNNTTITGNYSTYLGGGIYNDGTLNVNNSTISENRSVALGGGIYNEYTATATVNNSTIAGNSYSGIMNDAGILTINNSTIANNTGSGIYIYGVRPITTRNTIIAGNSGSDVSGDLGSHGHNLIGDTRGETGTLDPTDLRNVNPRLGPLQNNGGPTQTMALLPGSPAVDAGDNTDAPDFDQRGEGFPRIVGGTIDIGAFEAQIGAATTFRVDAPPTVPAGMPFDITVAALDAYNHVAGGYAGTVKITTSDPGEGIFLPPDYTFTANDGGIHTFPNGVTLVTPGDQTVTATDTKDDSITGNATVTVTDGGAPRMGSGHRQTPILEQSVFSNNDYFNWTGSIFQTSVRRKPPPDWQDFFFSDHGLEF
jgi:hypothetical protein